MTATEEDIDQDNIADVLVRDANGDLVIINGYTLTPSKYPYRKLYYSEPEDVRDAYKNYRHYIKDTYFRPVYDGDNVNLESYAAPQDKLDLMKQYEDAKFAKLHPRDRSTYQAFSKNYVAPLYKDLIEKYNLYSSEYKKPQAFMQCLKYAWDNWVVRPALMTLFGEDNVDDYLADEKFMRKIKNNKEYKTMVKEVVYNYFEHSDETNNDLFEDLSKAFVAIIDKYYEEKGIETCEEYGKENEEKKFESKLNRSPNKN